MTVVFKHSVTVDFQGYIDVQISTRLIYTNMIYND